MDGKSYLIVVGFFGDNRQTVVIKLRHPMLVEQDVAGLQSIVKETRNNSGMQELHSLANTD